MAVGGNWRERKYFLKRRVRGRGDTRTTQTSQTTQSGCALELDPSLFTTWAWRDRAVLQRSKKDPERMKQRGGESRNTQGDDTWSLQEKLLYRLLSQKKVRDTILIFLPLVKTGESDLLEREPKPLGVLCVCNNKTMSSLSVEWLKYTWREETFGEEKHQNVGKHDGKMKRGTSGLCDSKLQSFLQILLNM